MAENMTENARYIYSFFRARGWTSNSICGLLGNMQGESGIIANLDEYGGGGGYGLVQWTPKSNLTNWANQNGLNYTTVETQCKRIQWELENGQQFYATSAYPMNFKQFTQSTNSPTYLAKVFINNYERPLNPNQPQRGVWAEEWYSVLGGGTTPPSEDKKVKYLVVVGNSIDKRAGKYLADRLLCPVIDAELPYDYSVVERPIGVGATPTTNGQVGWSSYIKTVIEGPDRYDTAQNVLNFINGGCK